MVVHSKDDGNAWIAFVADSLEVAADAIENDNRLPGELLGDGWEIIPEPLDEHILARQAWRRPFAEEASIGTVVIERHGVFLARE